MGCSSHTVLFHSRSWFPGGCPERPCCLRSWPWVGGDSWLPASPEPPGEGRRSRRSSQRRYRLCGEFGGWFRQHRSILRFSAAALRLPGRSSSRHASRSQRRWWCVLSAFTGHGLPESPAVRVQGCPSLVSLLGISITQLGPIPP